MPSSRMRVIVLQEPPYATIRAILIIVAIVTVAKVVVTNTRLQKLALAAGYINKGIKGSHGPKSVWKKPIEAAEISRTDNSQVMIRFIYFYYFYDN